MKKIILSMLACLASVIAYIGVAPTSYSGFYQPHTPEELLK